MQLYDKDLLSVQEVRELVEKAKGAQEELSQQSQEVADRLVKNIARAGVRNAERLAQMAAEDTGFGIVADKVIKNVFGSQGVYDAIKDLKTRGEIAHDDVKKVRTIAIPMGIVAGIIPSTNPTSTTLYKAEIAIKAGNAIVFSPHPSALRCILETVKVIRQAITEAGGNENLVSCITIPTMQATDNLMKHPDISMILATGGSAMVRAAYSSGTPAIGVGPGNGPAYIEKTADLKTAVRQIIESKIFDNGTICASEQSVICDEDMSEEVQKEMQRQGAFFLSTEQAKQLGTFILRANGTMNPMIVGRSVQTIADLAGIKIPEGTKVIVAKENGIGYGHPYSNEKLAPILAFYTAPTYVEVCKLSTEILQYEGAGHTFAIHSQDEKIIDYFAQRIPASRIIVNSLSSLGGVGGTTGLMPSFTLGCGAIGGSATSDNVGPMNLINLRQVAYGIKELSAIRSEIKTGEDAFCPTYHNLDKASVEEIVAKIIEKLKTN